MNLNDYFEIAEYSVNKLDEINDRLKEISSELKTYQPPISGRLTLELVKCSKEGCIACPHPRWLSWKVIHTKYGDKKLASKMVDDPWRRIKGSGEFKENYLYIKALVLEAREIIKERQELTKAFQKLRTAAKNSLKIEKKNMNDKDDGHE